VPTTSTCVGSRPAATRRSRVTATATSPASAPAVGATVHEQLVGSVACAGSDQDAPVSDVRPAHQSPGHRAQVDPAEAGTQRERRHQRAATGPGHTGHRARAGRAACLLEAVGEVARAPAQQGAAAQAELGEHDLVQAAPDSRLAHRLAGCRLARLRVDQGDQLEIGIGVQTLLAACALPALAPQQPVTVGGMDGEHHRGTGAGPGERLGHVGPLVLGRRPDQQHGGDRRQRRTRLVEVVQQHGRVRGVQGQDGRRDQRERSGHLVRLGAREQRRRTGAQRGVLQGLERGGRRQGQRSHQDVGAGQPEYLPQPGAGTGDDVEVAARARDREAQAEPGPDVGRGAGVGLHDRSVGALGDQPGPQGAA